jgi:hypothetical protein
MLTVEFLDEFEGKRALDGQFYILMGNILG